MVNRESGWSVNRKNGQWSKSGQGVVNTAVIIRKKMQMGINVQSWQCVGGIEYIDSPVQLAKVQKWSTKRSYWINLTILNLCTNLKSASLFPLDGSDLPTITWRWKHDPCLSHTDIITVVMGWDGEVSQLKAKWSICIFKPLTSLSFFNVLADAFYNEASLCWAPILG